MLELSEFMAVAYSILLAALPRNRQHFNMMPQKVVL